MSFAHALASDLARGRALVFAGAVLSAFALPAAPVHACSCVPTDNGFLVADGTTMPANARGVPWAGWRPRDAKTGTWKEISADRFAVWRTDVNPDRKVEARVELVEGPLVQQGKPVLSTDLYLIAPVEWVPGARYRFIDRVLEQRAADARARGKEPALKETIEVKVGRKNVAAAKGVALAVTNAKQEELRVMTLGGSCSIPIRAHTRTVRMKLPRALEPYRNALLYTVSVADSQVWRPTRSLCSPGSPGRSVWFGPGKELLYVSCGVAEGYGASGDAGESLQGGAQRVRMTAWLPGTDFRLTAETETRLDCLAANVPKGKSGSRAP